MRGIQRVLMALVVTAATLAVSGSPAAAADTFQGNLEAVTSPAPGKIYLAGWMFDDDVPTVPISYHVYVGGTGPGDPNSAGFNMGPASMPRDDVAAHYPHAGRDHGFSATIDVPLHGDQMVYVFAINAGGPSNVNALLWSGSVFIANPPPDTSITTGPPAQGTNPSVTFGFGASEASTFTCRWDQGAWQACASPTTATVAVGAHTFAVRATDLAGASDPSPATYDFTVTAPPPPPPAVVPPVVVPPPQPPPVITLRLEAVGKKSRLKVDVGPDLNPSNYRFTVQRMAGRKWRTVRRTQTLGPRDVMVINLPRGTYRVVVPRQHDVAGTSGTVRLRR